MTLTTQDLEYADDGTTLYGVVVIDEARNHRCPGVLLIHGGAGLDGHARGQAHRYAELGYVVWPAICTDAALRATGSASWPRS